MRERLMPFTVRFWMTLLGLLCVIIGGQTAQPARAQGQNPTPQSVLPPAVVRFTADLSSVSLAAIEAGTAQATFTWQTVGLAENDRTYTLTLQYFEINDWKNIPLPPGQRLPPNGAARFALQKPLDFSAPSYRLLITDTLNQLISQAYVTIPYDLSAPTPPGIASFTSDSVSVSAGLLNLGQARVDVRWRVENRLPTANLEFYQVLADNTLRQIELPRANRYIDSIGSGQVAPVNVPNATSVRLRLRVVDLRDGKVYQEADIVLPITGGTALPAATPGVPASTNTPGSPSLNPTATPAA